MLSQRIMRIRPSDIAHIFLFLLAWPAAKACRLRRRHLWLICEDRNEARDNGYWLYRYVREHNPELDAVYAIDRRASDYEKVAALGETVPFGSFRHWVYYLAAEKNISTHKYGKPNAAVCYVLEVYGLLKNKRVFLQHGITINNPTYVNYRNSRLRLFVCGALPEYRFIEENFGYPAGYVQYLGFCRFDGLHDLSVDKKLILVVPTWRTWLHAGSDSANGRRNFMETEYYKKWNLLLNDNALRRLLDTYDLHMVFCPHRNMQGMIDCFRTDSKRIDIVPWGQCDVAGMLRDAALLITDYSSVSMDFAYMKKPVLYYQFDTERFHAEHLGNGFFDYEKDGFGVVSKRQEDLLEALDGAAGSGFPFSEKFLERHEAFFPLYDRSNCERNYQAIQTI